MSNLELRHGILADSDCLKEYINRQKVEELEKIKAEIDNPKTCMFAGTYEADWIMENIIDKHISELKGENNE